MGLIQSGASSAVDISTLGLGKTLKQLFQKSPNVFKDGPLKGMEKK